MKIRKRSISALVAAIVAISSWAVPAKRVPRNHVQSDGNQVTITLVGDEFSHGYVTQDGYTVMMNDNGDYCYYAAGTLSNVIAHNAAERSAAELQYVKSHASELDFATNNTIVAPRRAKGMVAAKDLRQTVHMGSPRIPIILVGYKDLPLKGDNPIENFNKHFNTNEWSALRYFTEQSFGQYTPQFDIIGVVNLTGNRSQYGANDRYGDDVGVGNMVAEACLEFKDKDWSVYDSDGNGDVDVVIVLYAGVGEAQSGVRESVWPCQWELSSSEYGKSIPVGDVIIDKFAVFNELYGSNDNTTQLDGIGVFCHEFSHCLGLPDFYQTSSYGAYVYGMGSWSLMDYGCYNNDTYRPVGYTAYERAYFDWIKLETPTPGSTLTLKPVSAGGKAYKIDNDQDATGNEYFIIEAREQTGWETFMVSSGLMVTHVDYDANVWEANTVNNNNQHKRMTIVPADNKPSDSNENGDLYPYNGNNMLTDDSTPAARVYTGEGSIKRLHKPITDITKNGDGTITLKFMPDAAIMGDVNGDGVVDVDDVNIIINIILGNDDAETYEGRADVNGDGVVDVDDVNEVINLILNN